MKIRRALLSVSDKTGLVDLGKALSESGAELVATGKTAQVLKDAGLKIVPIEQITGNPEAYQGRMKTLSFEVCSGILYRRNNPQDEADLKNLNHLPIDAVVVNFYPFNQTQAIEEIDVGGPTLVRAAAKNTPDVCVITDPHQYSSVIEELKKTKEVSKDLCQKLAKRAWDLVTEYDISISKVYGSEKGKFQLRYGENPHQKAHLQYREDSPIDWKNLTKTELSFNNILDLSSAYTLLTDLRKIHKKSTSVVILKHGNPCGVACLSLENSKISLEDAQLLILQTAWSGDPTSAFGGVVVFSDPLSVKAAQWLSQNFIELVSAPGLSDSDEALNILLQKRKNLKSIKINRFESIKTDQVISVPGGELIQQWDQEEALSTSKWSTVTKTTFPKDDYLLGVFGCLVSRALKSNAIALVRKDSVSGAYQLVGAGQGQPNRVDALEKLAIPRALNVLKKSSLEECVLVSDAFFPFKDCVEISARAGVKKIIQPGGSIKDQESIEACDEHHIAMVFTGKRHFKHV